MSEASLTIEETAAGVKAAEKFLDGDVTDYAVLVRSIVSAVRAASESDDDAPDTGDAASASAGVVAAIVRGSEALDIIAGELTQLRQAMQVKQQVKVGEETKENTIGFADVIGFFVNRTIAMDQAQAAQQSQAMQAAIASGNHMPPGGRNRRG